MSALLRTFNSSSPLSRKIEAQVSERRQALDQNTIAALRAQLEEANARADLAEKALEMLATEQERSAEAAKARGHKDHAQNIRKDEAAAAGLSLMELDSPGRTRRLTDVRGKIWFRMASETMLSEPHMGIISGNKDPTTVHDGILRYASVNNLKPPRGMTFPPNYKKRHVRKKVGSKLAYREITRANQCGEEMANG